jgi:hypothetical protein
MKNTPEDFINEYKVLCIKYGMHLDTLDEFHETMEDGVEVRIHNAPMVNNIMDKEDLEEFNMLMDIAILTTYTYATLKLKPNMTVTNYMNNKILEIMQKHKEHWTNE